MQHVLLDAEIGFVVFFMVEMAAKILASGPIA
jgi:hypothetical protein